MNQWIGLRENLQETMGFSHEIWCFPVEFSLKPIHWHNVVGIYMG